MNKRERDGLLNFVKSGARDNPAPAPKGLGTLGVSNFIARKWIEHAGYVPNVGPLYLMTEEGWAAYTFDRDNG